MQVLLLVVHVVAAIAIIGLVLIQHGKGADVGAAFGSGASGSVFGARGSANFMSRLTGILAAVFFVTSMGLTYVSTTSPGAGKGVMSQPAAGEKAGDKPSLPGQIPQSGAPAAKSDIPAAPKSDAAPAVKADAPSLPATTDSKAKDVPK